VTRLKLRVYCPYCGEELRPVGLSSFECGSCKCRFDVRVEKLGRGTYCVVMRCVGCEVDGDRSFGGCP